jgi:hypothetical protein
MQAFLEYVVKGLVQNPGAVTVTPVERAGMTVYELRMDSSDVGKIIGRQGKQLTRSVLCFWPVARRKVCVARLKLSKTNRRVRKI